MDIDKDELIQQYLDSKESMKGIGEDWSDTDITAYRIVFDQIKKPLNEGTSYSFKANLLKNIEIEKRRSKDTALFLTVIFVIVIGTVIIIWMIGLLNISLEKFLRKGQILTILSGMGFVALLIVAERALENKIKARRL